MPTATSILDPRVMPHDPDRLPDRYRDLLTGTYDCVDRIVVNAYNGLCHSPGGFRFWWRRLEGGDAHLDTAHLMRLAGRFARRVRAWAKANGVPVIDCARGERKHRIAEEHLSARGPRPGIFLILVARAPATVWEVTRSASAIRDLRKRQAFVSHYSFHIWDPRCGHLTIKMSGHPPFAAQVILNGHELVACAAQAAGVAFRKEGNCFTACERPAELAQLADTLASDGAAGRLREICDRWIYSACLIFGLDLAEQERSGFRYDYSVYQVEYSRNLLFRSGGEMEEVFQGLVDRDRARLDLRQIRTIFGKGRHAVARADGTSPVSLELGGPTYSLTVFKLHFGRLTFKAYTKGERVLRFEAIAHNTQDLHCGRVISKFGEVVARLRAILERALGVLRGLDRAFVSDGTLDDLPRPSTVGRTRVGGVDIGKPRMRTVMHALLALAPAPGGFSAGELAAQVRQLGGSTMSSYDARRAAYDLKKMRGKGFVARLERSHRYQLLTEGVPTLAALVLLREKVLRPLLAAAANPPRAPIRVTPGHKRSFWERVDYGYSRFRRDVHRLLSELRLISHRQTFVDGALASAALASA